MLHPGPLRYTCPMAGSNPSKPRLGISACLLGQEVRFNGGHKRDDFLVDTFGRWVEWVAVCPEVEIGMGTPRPPIRLERRDGDLRLVTLGTGEDHSDSCGPGPAGGPRSWPHWISTATCSRRTRRAAAWSG